MEKLQKKYPAIRTAEEAARVRSIRRKRIWGAVFSLLAVGVLLLSVQLENLGRWGTLGAGIGLFSGGTGMLQRDREKDNAFLAAMRGENEDEK